MLSTKVLSLRVSRERYCFLSSPSLSDDVYLCVCVILSSVQRRTQNIQREVAVSRERKNFCVALFMFPSFFQFLFLHPNNICSCCCFSFSFILERRLRKQIQQFSFLLRITSSSSSFQFNSLLTLRQQTKTLLYSSFFFISIRLSVCFFYLSSRSFPLSIRNENNLEREEMKVKLNSLSLSCWSLIVSTQNNTSKQERGKRWELVLYVYWEYEKSRERDSEWN